MPVTTRATKRRDRSRGARPVDDPGTVEARYLRRVPHLSDSEVQRAAEAVIVERPASDLGVQLSGGRVAVGSDAYVDVDARSPDGTDFVEAYARQGALKGAQLKKIGQDILKLALLRRQPEYGEARVIIAFASAEAHAPIRRWVAKAAADFGVELRTVGIPPDFRDRILQVQQRQVMVNLSVDDALALEEK